MKIYVDGSYNPKTKVWGGAAILMSDENDVIKEILVSDKDLNGSRQINGELESTIHALRYVLEHLHEIDDKKITIFYDYEGIEKWATGEWTARKDVAIDYKKRVQRHLMLLRYEHKIEIIFTKVKAHSGEEFNEKVDRLAKSACNVE